MAAVSGPSAIIASRDCVQGAPDKVVGRDPDLPGDKDKTAVKKTWWTHGEKLVSRAAHALEHHPRQITALLAALMLTAGGGAYAVAALGPDPSALPVREILENVQTLPLAEQSEALDAHRFSLFSAEQVRPTDSAESLLARLGVNDPAAAAFLRQDALA